MAPLAILVVLVVGFGIFDVASSWGKIHPGVSVQGVDVGGLTVEQAGDKLESALSPQLADASVTAYEGSDTATQDGSQVDDQTNVESAYADSSDENSVGTDVNDDGKNDKWNITSETIGAYIDGDALASSAYKIGREGNALGERLGAWLQGRNLAATVSYNAESLNGLIDDINDAIGTKVVDSKIRISSGKTSVVNGSDGRLVDQDAFVKRFSSAAFNKDAPYYIIPMKTEPMRIHPETAQKISDQVATAIGSDFKIIYESDTWTLDPSDLGGIISQKVLEPNQKITFGNSTQKVVDSSDTSAASTGTAKDVTYDTSAGLDSSSGYTLQAYVDQSKLDKYLVKLLGNKATGGAKSASFDTSSGKVVIKPSKTGTGPDRASAELGVQNALFGTGADGQPANATRTVTMENTTIEPELTTEEAQQMGIEDRLASWSIPMSGSSSRQKNIRLLCKLINNSLVKPGASWSFNGTTGERTAAKGFETAPVIVNGRHEDQLGGGICQVATCVFNAACFSGLGIGTRANHAFYIPTYDDKGFADATVSWETPDLEWVNDTSHYILLTAGVVDGNVTVSLWGTDEGREVTCDRGDWKAGDKYKTIKENDNSLPEGTQEVTQTGRDGRSIYIHYIAKDKNGKVLHDINFHSVYQAQNEIIKVGTKKK